MRRGKTFPSAVLATFLVTFPGTVAVAAAQVVVEIVTPRQGEPLFGPTEVVARVRSSEPIERVEVRLDGRLAGTLREAPYRLTVDAGESLAAHRIEVVAYTASGAVARGERAAPALRIHDKVEIELQQLYVTVRDRRGRVLDLTREDLEVLDERRPQEIVTFARGDIPLTTVLLVDGSASMRGDPLRTATTAAWSFVERMAEHDEARLVVYGDRLLKITPWSGHSDELTEALGLAPGAPLDVADLAGTAILDHLFLALSLLEERQGHRVVLLLSDGWDAHSALRAKQVRQIAQRGQATVYWVRLGITGDADVSPASKPRVLSAWRDQAAVDEIVTELEAIVDETGGRVVRIAGVDEVEAAFADVLAELREQYALGYDPDPRRNDGAWRKVRVLVGRPGLRVQTRKGYVDR